MDSVIYRPVVSRNSVWAVSAFYTEFSGPVMSELAAGAEVRSGHISLDIGNTAHIHYTIHLHTIHQNE